MPILHLGVIDLPYANAPRSRRARRARSGTQTTGDVAQFLENDYGVMEHFAKANEQFVIDELGKSAVGAIESLMAGGPPLANPYGGATSRIEERFKDAISNQEFDSLTGVPTQAALRGVDHRKKHPYARRAPRPSFRDTGLYQASFKSWVD